MSTIGIVLLMLGLVSLMLLTNYIDAKYQYRFTDWFNGRCVNPFLKSNGASSQTMKEKDQKIAELTERIQVLEKIVTEPAYELNQKINALK